MDDKSNPHDKSSSEKAEGSRENVNVDPHDVNEGSATERMERGSGQVSHPDKPLASPGGGGAGGSAAGPSKSAQRSAGITNRPVEEEQQNQEELPPRGKAKPGASAS